MTSIPENAEDNKYLQALQALKFEGKPEDVALEFLEKSKEALEKYKSSDKFAQLKEAMYYICNAIDHVKEDSTVPDQVKFDLYFYRSEIQIMVKNYGHGVDDLKSALFHVENDDAYLRLIECYLKLESFDKAIKIISIRKKKIVENQVDEILTHKLKLYELEEKKIKSLQNELLSKLENLETFKNKATQEKIKLYDVLTRKGIKIKPQVHKIPANVEANIYIDEDKIFHFPVLIIWDEFNTTDYIQDVDENTMISDILQILLGDDNFLPYDKDKKYNINTCICYYEVSENDPILKKEINYYYPLRNDERLIDALTNSKVHMNGFPVITIVSQISNYFLHFVKNKNIIKRKRQF